MLYIPFLLLLCCCAQSRSSNSPMPGHPAPAAATSVQENPEAASPEDTSLPGNPESNPGLTVPESLDTDSALPTPESLDTDSALPAPESLADSLALPASALPSDEASSALANHAPSSVQTVSDSRAGIPSMENLIHTALEPVGSTMYVWGGGWNEADTGAGPGALTIGCSQRWAEFAAEQGSDYDYRKFRYKIHDGLDCSGYIGWILYNIFHIGDLPPENIGFTEDSQPDSSGFTVDSKPDGNGYTKDSQPENSGFVTKSSLMAKTLADYGWGELIPAADITEWKPGDICSMSGHVWLSLGTCKDGSVLLLHSSPPGVRICGTSSGGSEKTDAVRLAEEWMSACYPDWYAKFPECGVSNSYLTSSDIMRWNSETLADAGQFQAMSAEETLEHFMPGE